MASETIVAVKKDEMGKLSHVKYESGVIHSVEEAVLIAKQGGITNAVVGANRYGIENLRGKRDREDKKGQFVNLTDLPGFEEVTL